MRSIDAEQEVPHTEIDDELRERFADLPPDEYPNFVRMLDLLTSGTADARFRFGLELMIEGLLHSEPPDVVRERGRSPRAP